MEAAGFKITPDCPTKGLRPASTPGHPSSPHTRPCSVCSQLFVRPTSPSHQSVRCPLRSRQTKEAGDRKGLPVLLSHAVLASTANAARIPPRAASSASSGTWVLSWVSGTLSPTSPVHSAPTLFRKPQKPLLLGPPPRGCQRGSCSPVPWGPKTSSHTATRATCQSQPEETQFITHPVCPFWTLRRALEGVSL